MDEIFSVFKEFLPLFTAGGFAVSADYWFGTSYRPW